MSNPIEEGKGARTLEELLPEATKVYIRYVDGGQLGQGGWLELAGDGTKALKELAERFGEKGVEAFNKGFITPEFDQGLKNRADGLTTEIIAAADEHDAPDISWMRGQWGAERRALENVLREIRNGGEISILLTSEASYVERGLQFGKAPARDAMKISLKKPAVTV